MFSLYFPLRNYSRRKPISIILQTHAIRYDPSHVVANNMKPHDLAAFTNRLKLCGLSNVLCGNYYGRTASD